MKLLLISFLLIFSTLALSAQISNAPILKNLTSLRASTSSVSEKMKFLPSLFFHQNQKLQFSQKPFQSKIPCVYAYKDLAFFCKIEFKLEKAVYFPIKFRLSTVEQIDFLEGKRKSY